MLAARSAWNRRLTLGLAMSSIALSVALLMGVNHVREAARTSFAHSVSDTDLVIGARTGPVQLMLYAVFRIGEATNNIRWQSFLDIAANPLVSWAIPLSLGDSHRGYPVLGTSVDYFERFRFGRSQPLTMASGRPFDAIFEAVVGAEVARNLRYAPGERIVLNHGTGEVSFAAHSDQPFVVVGVLAPTGTPVDRSVHVPLAAIEAIHLAWQGGAPMPGVVIAPEHVSKFDLTPKSITAILVGLKNRAAVFRMQRSVNEYAAEPLLAVLPAAALEQLWRIIGTAEQAMLAISAMVLAVGMTGMVAVVLASLNERRRELSILRALGARPVDIFVLLMIEGAGVTLLGALIGVALLGAAIALFGSLATAHYGIVVSGLSLGRSELGLLAAIGATGLLASLLPGYRAYRLLLADGLAPRL